MAGHGFSHAPVQVPDVHTRYRRIKTALPVPESLPLLQKLYDCESRSMHGQLPVVWDRAEGFQVHDAWGNTWIDFTSTIFVTNAGHGNAAIIESLQALLHKPLLHSYTYATKERADYIEQLIKVTPPQFEKAFLLSAGTEATECALKLMRLNAAKTGKRRPGILCFEGNWHGRTMGAQMLSWNPAQKEWIGFNDPNIFHLPFPYPWRAEALSDPVGYFERGVEALCADKDLDPATDFCGVMMETFQGWGAVFYPEAFVQAVERFCRKHGLLMAFDEMQAGFGRTGRLFGYMHYGVEPDLLCCGKGAASGVPLAIVLGSAQVMDLPDVGSMSSTHSANPLVCVAGLANLRVLLEEGMISRAVELGIQMHAGLNDIQREFPNHLAHVLGKGLLAALIFNDAEGRPLPELCDRICEEAMRRGLLLVHTGRESIKIAPPLCIEPDALAEGLQVLREVVRDEAARS
jgi:4-aminobutyrate aminotransferase/(S)-3-amino-2-methylpropionate transaminase